MNLSKLRKMAVDGDMSISALRYLLDCRTECEHLDYKESIHIHTDYGIATLARDIVAMRNVGGGYIVVGVKDKTWDPIGLPLDFPLDLDTKKLRDSVRKATGVEIEVDIVRQRLTVQTAERDFALILIRATSKRSKLRSPTICAVSFHAKEDWGVRNGEIYVRRGDQTVRVTSRELEELIADLVERHDQSEMEQEQKEPSPFWVETGLYRLLPREYDTFIGRTELQAANRKAIEGDPRIWIIDLYGPGGVGKSALASSLAYHYYEARQFEAILQLSAKDRQLTSTGIARLQPTLFSLENLIDYILLLFAHGEFVNEDLRKRKEVVIELLSAFSLLLILDNMETVTDGRVLEFVRALPPSVKTRVLLTSRSRTQGWEMPIAVTELDRDEVREFLRVKAKAMDLNLTGDFNSLAEKIRVASGGLPLAIQWILGQLKLTKDLDSVVDQVRDKDSPLLEFSFRNSWYLLSAEARAALAVLSIFEQPPTLHLWATALDWSAEQVEKAAAQLVEATFVTKIVDQESGHETYQALPITLSFARNELARMGDLELTTRTRYQRHQQEMDLVAAETERFTDVFERYEVERETEKRAVILARKAEFHVSTYNYDEAERLLRMAEGIDPRSVYVLVNYGLLKLEMGHIGEALTLIERASAHATKNSGFWVYHSLSRVYDAERNRPKVEECLRKALTYSPKHPFARHQLAVVLGRVGRYKEANDILDELIADELGRTGGPSYTLVVAYKTKIRHLVKSGRKPEACTTLDNAIAEAGRWPQIRDRIPELEDALAQEETPGVPGLPRRRQDRPRRIRGIKR